MKIVFIIFGLFLVLHGNPLGWLLLVLGFTMPKDN